MPQDSSRVMSVRNRRAQFATIPTALLTDPDYSSLAKTLYAVLDQYGDGGGGSFPGQEHLSEILGKSAKPIRAALKELADGGWLVTKRRGQGRSNYYWVNDRPDRDDEPDEEPPELDRDDSPVLDRSKTPVLDESKTPVYIEPEDIEPVDKENARVAALDLTTGLGLETANEGHGLETAKTTTEALSFSDFYDGWPNKKSRATAIKAWAKLSDADKGACVAGVEPYIAYVESVRRFGGNLSFLHPATFINNRRWEDDFTLAEGRTVGPKKETHDEFVARVARIQNNLKQSGMVELEQ